MYLTQTADVLNTDRRSLLLDKKVFNYRIMFNSIDNHNITITLTE